MINQSNPKQYDILHLHMKSLKLEIVCGSLLLKQLNIQNGNKFALLYKLWDYVVSSIKVRSKFVETLFIVKTTVDVTMLVKNCVFRVDSTLNLKSKITVANKNFSIRDRLKTTKQDDGSYLSLKKLQEVLVSSWVWSALNK